MVINNKITDLKPSIVWHYFDEITRIPRASKHEELIVAYIEKFAKDHKLQYKKDKVGNVVISKPATLGFENHKKIILQSHVDMVCEKIDSSKHNFDTDAIETYIDDKYVRSQGTTLGADDGIGVALELAILASDDLQHAPIDCMFTVDEETGLTGAYAIEKSFFDGDLFINLDSEEDYIIYIGCAGGCTTQARFTIYEKQTSEGYLGIEVNIKGLLGGHSGTDINLGRGNANKIAARFVRLAIEQCEFELSEINGGKLHNAIPREAKIVGVIPFAYREKIRVLFNLFSADIQDELKGIEPNLDMQLSTTDVPTKVFTTDFTKRLIYALLACPHGVIAMSQQIPNLVETSTNLASIKREGNSIIVGTSQRSSIDSSIAYVSQMVESTFYLAGAEVIVNEGYPAWQPNVNSELLNKAKQLYLHLFNEEVEVKAIHAGLECGLFAGKCPNLDMISIGPTLHGVHSPNECVEIESVAKIWTFITNLIML